MTMTKAEKAEMDALRTARDLARALRWPEYAEPEPMGVEEIKANQTFAMKPRWGSDQFACAGWTAHLAGYSRTPTVAPIYSNGTKQTGDADGQSWAQGSGRLYRSRTDALRHLRLSITDEYAASLAKVDAMLAAEATD